MGNPEKFSFKRPQSLSAKIADHLRDQIVRGDIGLGASLAEERLAEQLEVSRTPVREAFSRLEFEGLVSVIPQKGTFVFMPNEKDVRELCDFRYTLEVRAATLALSHDPQGLHTQMSNAFQTMRVACETKDMSLYAQADSDFHNAFVEGCDNNYIRQAFSIGSGRVAALRVHLAAFSKGEPDRSFAEHEAMVALCAERDADGIQNILRAHIMRTQENYLNAMNSGALGLQPVPRAALGGARATEGVA